jgi:thiol-disulfide isomerase/thioredoxin
VGLAEALGEGKPVTGLTLVADFTAARLNEPIDKVAFEFKAPDEAVLVRYFVNARPPLPPSEKLGQPIGPFTFETLDGQAITRNELAGKVAVLYFWAAGRAPSLQSLPELEKIYQRYKDNDKIIVLAVHIEEKDASVRMMQDVLAQANLAVTVVRDSHQDAHNVFGIEEIPNLFVLGPDGVVEDNEIGFDPQLATDLPWRLDKLLAGESIYGDAPRHYEARLRQYKQAIAAAQVGADPQSPQIVRADIAPASEPKTLKRAALWNCRQLQQPGNILAVGGADGNSRILVNDGWRSVAQIGPRGSRVKTYPLDIPGEPAEVIVSYLRTATDSDAQRYFVGSGPSQQQLHLFDNDFNRLMSFPEGKHAGIADVQMADLNGDGQPEINVGYWGVVGVQNVSLEGRRLWSNRTLENVFCLAVTGPDEQHHRELLCGNMQGTLVPIDYRGQEGPPIVLDNRFVRFIAAEDLTGDGKPEYCVIAAPIAAREQGAYWAVGIDQRGTELWRYKLPVGEQPVPEVGMLSGGNLLSGETGQWVISGADGSIHILQADGSPVDDFHVGQPVSGLAVAQIDGQGVLVVATHQRVEAWRFD